MSGQPVEVSPGVWDWSTVHQPTGELFAPVQTPVEWQHHKLSADLVQRYWKDGVLLNVPILTPDECDLILEDYKYLSGEKPKHAGHELLYEYHSNQSTDPSLVLMHGLGQWRMTRLFHDLVFHPKITVPVSQLLVEGRDMPVRFWHDQFFAKPARCGSVVAWHQDYSYWTRTIPMMHCTVHIALDDQTLDNGPLMYIPGSHRWLRNGNQPLPVLDFNFTDMAAIHSILTEEEEQNFKPVSANLKKGEASFHCAMTVHGSFSNKSDFSRRATVLNYFADGVISDTDEELIGESRIPKGQKMEGQFYPLVYDPKWAS